MQVRNLKHPLLPTLTPDERSRQRTVVALRRMLNSELRPRNIDMYEQEGLPAFRARHDREPQSQDEIEEAMFSSTG